MSLIKLPEIKALEKPKGVSWDAPSDVLSKWSSMPMAAEADDPNTISIYDQIGEDPWSGGGITAKRISAALRNIGSKDVTVNINSPGGDFFEGLAIYNLLLEHPAKVTVKVMGYAASAASIIAMAGDDIKMAQGSFFMIHNAWGVAIGNQHDMRKVADILAPFDASMAEIYTARTGQKQEKIIAMMDEETWINGKEAVNLGFADQTTNEKLDTKANSSTEIIAKRKIDAILASQGLSRKERRQLMKEISGKQDAAEPVTHDADINAGLLQLIETLKT